MTFNAAETSTHDGQPVRCYRFAHGASIWRHTSADRAIVITDGTFLPEAIEEGSIHRSREWDSGGVELTVDRSHPVALLFGASRPREPVLLTIYAVQRLQDDVFPVRFNGEVARAVPQDHSVSLHCVPISYRMKRRVPYLRYSALCPLALYGSRCGVDRELFRQRVVVASVSVSLVQSAAFSGFPDGWFTNGYLRTLGGETRFVVAHTGDLVTLEYPLAISAGEAIDAFPGCDRSEATCTSKFNNFENHLGFAHIPNRDLFGKAVE